MLAGSSPFTMLQKTHPPIRVSHIPGAFAVPVELANLAAVSRLGDVVDLLVGLGPLAVLRHEP